MKDVIALVAMTLNVIAYLLYFWQIKKEKSLPNPTTWGLWAFITAVDFSSYWDLSGDIFTSLTFMIDSVACISIFIYLLWRRKRKLLPNLEELTIFVLSAIALYIWWCLKSVETASIVICIASTLASIPTLRDVWNDPQKESPLSWWFSTVSYFFMAVCVAIDRGRPVEFVAPIALTLVHAGVAVLASRNKKEKNIFKK